MSAINSQYFIGGLMPESAITVQQSGTIIEIRPYHGGWQCFEGDGVQPYFVEGDAKRSAVEYATARMTSRPGQIRIYGLDGVVERTLQLDPRPAS